VAGLGLAPRDEGVPARRAVFPTCRVGLRESLLSAGPGLRLGVRAGAPAGEHRARVATRRRRLVIACLQSPRWRAQPWPWGPRQPVGAGGFPECGGVRLYVRSRLVARGA